MHLTWSKKKRTNKNLDKPDLQIIKQLFSEVKVGSGGYPLLYRVARRYQSIATDTEVNT